MIDPIARITNPRYQVENTTTTTSTVKVGGIIDENVSVSETNTTTAYEVVNDSGVKEMGGEQLVNANTQISSSLSTINYDNAPKVCKMQRKMLKTIISKQ